ncbi:ankyrin repeat-containing domain protein [Pyronema domesticum]|nr:ankyrin repeat-containing domain protein [Pyronema domesticum]
MHKMKKLVANAPIIMKNRTHLAMGLVFSALIDHRASANGRCGSGTVLHCVVDGARLRKDLKAESEFVAILLRKQAHAHALDGEGSNVLHIAAGNGDEATVRALVERGMDPFDQSRNCEPPFWVAMKNRHQGVVRWFLQMEFKQRGSWNSLILLLSKEGVENDDVVMKALASANFKDQEGWTVLHYFSQRGDAGTVEKLLRARVEVDAVTVKHETALILAARKGYKEVVKLLVDAGAGVEKMDQDGETPLILSAIYNHIEVARVLIEKGANVRARNKNNKDALGHAAAEGYTEILELPLKMGAEVNGVGWNCATPIGEAAWFGRVEAIRVLEKHRADLDVSIGGGSPLLIYAVDRGHYEAVRVLLELGADGERMNHHRESVVTRAHTWTDPK